MSCCKIGPYGAINWLVEYAPQIRRKCRSDPFLNVDYNSGY